MLRFPVPLDMLRRFVAAGSAGLVLALVIFAASPALHGELHEANHHEPGEDRCAIALFAGGVAPSLELVLTEVPASAAVATLHVADKEVLWASPSYLRPPECGPPRVES